MAVRACIVSAVYQVDVIDELTKVDHKAYRRKLRSCELCYQLALSYISSNRHPATLCMNVRMRLARLPSRALSKHAHRRIGAAVSEAANVRSSSTLRRCTHIGLQQRPLIRQLDIRFNTRDYHARLHSSPSNLLTGEPTIYALSTASGRAAIAIIRISGPATTHIYQCLCPSKPLPKPRFAAVRSLYTPHLPPSPSTLLDSSALILHFPGPNTATGENILELHVHGGPAIVRAILSAIPLCSSEPPSSLSQVTTAIYPIPIRYAEPGEFTRRAFQNNRLDLTQIEALGASLSATTEQQRRLSVRGTQGSLALTYEKWRQGLLYARGELEALIDFSEDQHFDESARDLASNVARQVQSLLGKVRKHMVNAVKGELLRNGILVSLLGAPNAGKSSLLNRVVGREAAIVSREAGTTRDVVEVGVDLGGYLVRLGDTAGLRKASGSNNGSLAVQMKEVIGMVEEEGMRRAKQRAKESDVVIAVLSFEETVLQDQVGTDESHALYLDPEVISTAESSAQEKKNVVVVINKMDCKPARLSPDQVIDSVAKALPSVDRSLIRCISCRNAEDALDMETDNSPDPGGIQTFLNGLITKFNDMTKPVVSESDSSDLDTQADTSAWEESLGATERHRLLLEECSVHLEDFLRQVESQGVRSDETSDETGENEDEIDIVLAAESLRSAGTCLAKITGKGEAGDVEEVLGVVFEKFCVGK